MDTWSVPTFKVAHVLFGVTALEQHCDFEIATSTVVRINYCFNYANIISYLFMLIYNMYVNKSLLYHFEAVTSL